MMGLKKSPLNYERLAIFSLNVIRYIGLPASFLLCSAVGATAGIRFQDQLGITLTFLCGVLAGFGVGSLMLGLWVRIVAACLGIDKVYELIDRELAEDSSVSKLMKAVLRKINK